MRHKIRAIHFIGIGGAGMAGLAEVMHHLGYVVTGSDMREQPTLERLRTRGVTVQTTHAAAHVADADCVVYSGAVAADNVERAAAVARGVPVIPRAQMLGELMRFKPGIAVSGTHGKTTVSSMIAAVLTAAGWSPTCVIGGLLRAVGEDDLVGEGDYIVVEADESDASFLHLQPHLAVVTNIDDDHLEAFPGGLPALTQAFAGFLGNLPFYGAAILCADDAATRALAATIKSPRCLTYGFDAAAVIRADNARPHDGGMAFTLSVDGESDEFYVRAIGRHNVQNALAACAVAYELGIDKRHWRAGLAAFAGVGRRLESYGEMMIGGSRVLVVDDYAHHPTEMTATLNALRDVHRDRRLVLVFQPHRFSRTRRLINALALAVAAADVVVLTAVYAAGEQAPAEDLTAQLFAAIPAHVNKTLAPTAAEVDACLPAVVAAGDLLVCMGAGDIGAAPARWREGAANG